LARADASPAALVATDLVGRARGRTARNAAGRFGVGLERRVSWHGRGGVGSVGRYRSDALTFVLTFALGIYGGLYSGGYVTVLTVVLVAFFGLGYAESIASTKVINVFSSSVATAVFAWQGLIEYRLGLILGATMFAGAYVGAHYASKMNETWLRRIFLFTVFLLALKTLIDIVRA
jgi:uncharacterized membrane protein YfcA